MNYAYCRDFFFHALYWKVPIIKKKMIKMTINLIETLRNKISKGYSIWVNIAYYSHGTIYSIIAFLYVNHSVEFWKCFMNILHYRFLFIYANCFMHIYWIYTTIRSHYGNVLWNIPLSIFMCKFWKCSNQSNQIFLYISHIKIFIWQIQYLFYEYIPLSTFICEPFSRIY